MSGYIGVRWTLNSNAPPRESAQLMSKEFLRDREKALEDSFFFEKDKELLDQLRNEVERELQMEALESASGIKDKKVLQDLLDAGISAKTAASLSLVPLIVVAWADGTVQPQERQAILEGAAETGMTVGDAAYELLNGWLEERPDDSLFNTWKEYIHALAKAVSPETLAGLRENITERIREIAKAAGGILGMAKIDVSEKRVMQEIEAVFDAE